MHARSSTAYRGVALIYALVAVLVISVLVLGVGRLVSFHAVSESTAQGYARAIYCAEAAAAWQMARMSRCNLPGAPAVSGRLPWEVVNTWNEASNRPEPYVGPLPASDLGTSFEGTVKVWVKSAALGGVWTAPEDFVLFAIGTDPVTGIQRGITLNGTGTGLGDQYALFAQGTLLFESLPLTPGSTGVALLKMGYIGANGSVAFNTRGAPPQAQLPSQGGLFFGCRLGPDAVLQPGAGAWTAGWDIPRLPDVMRWPTIEDVLAYVWKGRTPAQAAALNDNVQIQYRNADGTFSSFSPPPRQLTAAEFDRSTSRPYRTIRIRARLDAPHHNLIYLENIRMRSTDVLILDLRKEFNDDRPTGIRILIHNPALGANEGPVITNLAYFETENSLAPGDQRAQSPSYIWFNNTSQPLTYRPHLALQELDRPPAEDPDDWNSANYRYRIRPSLRGLVYGMAALPAPDAGSVVIEGDPAAPAGGATIQSVVANRIVVRGRVTVNNAEPVESARDRHRYVLYYRVKSRSRGEILPNFTPDNPGFPMERGPVYDYGPFVP
ncbi:MAG: hypothetical protein RMJ43_01085 [Chloroherpetonaceae bacterium]|nr:hypothetical protein [Chthonomonadaceae bacterium]MDW8206403.1 hypothetical protein [Chloroherpetonaceae bacterium]